MDRTSNVTDTFGTVKTIAVRKLRDVRAGNRAVPESQIPRPTDVVFSSSNLGYDSSAIPARRFEACVAPFALPVDVIRIFIRERT